MKSKMKPVRLVYSTEESVQALKSVPTFASSTLQLLGSHQSQHPYCYELMFKVGDDLRQDVLILQMFSCFNSLWLQHDLDLKLLSYKCVAAELDAGLIEMVQNASTISKIQQWYNEEKKKAFGSLSVAWSRDVIYLWLASDICNGNKPLPNEIIEKATTEFILSCAGSCVASYVLGIGDRHNDNIMVHRSGRLFHIDFGHILGRKKSKFGINRERVPLILPASFMYIINRDYEANNDQSPSYRRNFEFFKRLLIQAFMVLRDNVDMVCNMLYAMKNAGMPELKSLSDVNYVRETLFVGDTREEAEKKFVQKINDSTKSSWTVNVNWATHNYKHWK
ncbi:phosphatidylinositol 4,5-bisphosphate 3-kinase catalytic subunit delta isoform-like [Convolutriloba macropyga]|uniref:phosphatidylinositol 4,5-bisphosphate 3-kinase catalytic subunit delta isoform-like n=1 Tax=Convolutriloba macropyga TaxID=536237 RepID=UPI003F524E77